LQKVSPPKNISIFHKLRDVDLTEFCGVEASFCALEVLDIISEKHEDMVIGRATLCLGDEEQFSKDVFGDTDGHFGLIFHSVYLAISACRTLQARSCCNISGF